MTPQSKAAALKIKRELRINDWLSSTLSIKFEIGRRVKFIRDQMIDSGTQGLVLGISGGVDSMVAGQLCQMAVNMTEGTRFVAMRLPYNVQADENDAIRSIDFIQPTRIVTVNIKPAVQGLVDELTDMSGQTEAKHDFMKGNIKARTRMMAQYAVANGENLLVVGTDHAAEAVMGFFTKHGDGACDIAPLAGLTKGQVRAIGRVLGAPEDLVDKTPTADLEELDPAKPDELAYGCTYEQIDDFLLGNDVDEDVAQKIISAYNRTAHKRAMPATPN